LILAAVGWAAFGSVSASPRPTSLVGEWRLNLKESELLPEDAPLAELVMAVTKDDGKSFRWTATVKLPDGQSGSTGFDGAIDGKPYPVQGRPGSTSAFTWLSDGALKQVSQSAAGIAVENCTFSSDFRKMNCNARQTDIAGRATSYVEVFDRQ
jgi:hypothetical protein